MKRKPRADSVTEQVSAMLGAAQPLPAVPAHVKLREGDQPFWEGVLRARARDEWSDADLVVGAQLARCQADIERESVTLDAESTVVTNERGTPVVNPRVSVLEQLARREMALMRTLRMGGRIMGETDKLGVRRGIQKQAEQARQSVQDEDELLAL